MNGEAKEGEARPSFSVMHQGNVGRPKGYKVGSALVLVKGMYRQIGRVGWHILRFGVY